MTEATIRLTKQLGRYLGASVVYYDTEKASEFLVILSAENLKEIAESMIATKIQNPTVGTATKILLNDLNEQPVEDLKKIQESSVATLSLQVVATAYLINTLHTNHVYCHDIDEVYVQFIK